MYMYKCVCIRTVAYKYMYSYIYKYIHTYVAITLHTLMRSFQSPSLHTDELRLVTNNEATNVEPLAHKKAPNTCGHQPDQFF